jgi:hypothetical protein
MVAIFADSNRARMRYIRTTDGWGTIPTAGSTRELRYTGSTVTASKQTVISDEIRADRMIPDVIETSAKSAGQVNIEFSAGSHDDFLESFMMGAWTRPMTFDSLTGNALAWASSSTLTYPGDVTDYFFVGRRIRTVGFLNPSNNDYFQISAIAFAGGVTTITVTTATAVVEAGSIKTSLYDANDVIVLKNTAFRIGTGGASTIDSNSTNAFASAITAGQLNVGQKIWVEGLGRESGSVVYTGQPAAGDVLTLSDGVQTLAFQFGGVAPIGTVAVVIGGTDSVTLANLVAAVNAQRVAGNIGLTASLSTLTVTFQNTNLSGGSIVKTTDAGDVATVTNFTGGNATARGVFTIDDLTNDVLTVSPQPPTLANGGDLPVTIKGSMLRNPTTAQTIIPQDYVIETGFEDVSQYFVADGQRVGGFTLDFSANAILKGDFTFSGRGMQRLTSSMLGNADTFTVLGTTSTEIANSTVNVGFIHVNDQVLSTAIQSITVTGDNALRDQNAVGYKYPAGIGAGRQEIKGAVKAYFADGSLWDQFNNHTTVSISFDVQDVDGHTYYFTVPSAKFSTDTVNPAAGNQDVMEDFEYIAFRDPTTACQLQVDRFSSLLPVTA